MLIDALGHNFLRSVEFLPEFEYRVGLRIVLGYSCACHPTLLTGKLPHEHGHGAMFQRRSGPSALDVARPWSRLPSFLADHSRVRAHIDAAVRRRVSGYFSLYECPTRLLPEFDLVEPVPIFGPGSVRLAPNIFDQLEEAGVPYRAYDWRTPEEENLLAVETDIDRGDAAFIFLYLPGLDGRLHEYGSAGQPVLDHLRWYEDWMRRLYALAEKNNEVVEFFVFSDHGMSDVHGGVDVKGMVEQEFGPNGRRYLAFYDSTMARFWVDEPSVAERLEAFLGDRTEGRWLRSEEKGELGVDFKDRSQGDLIFVMREGLLINPSYMGRNLLAGMHGYLPDAVDADACLLGPWSPSEDITHLKDLHGLMLATVARLVEERA